MAAMLNGAGALAFLGRLFGSHPADLEREAARDYRGPGELICLPYLSGERTPHDDPHARGVFFGLSNSTDRADFVRAAMEGVALTLVDARDCVESAAAPIGEIGLIGGGAKSQLWTRMIASALGRRIVRYRDGEAGPAFGAARLARLATTSEQGAGDRRCDGAGAGIGQRVPGARRAVSPALPGIETGVCRRNSLIRSNSTARSVACSIAPMARMAAPLIKTCLYPHMPTPRGPPRGPFFTRTLCENSGPF